MSKRPPRQQGMPWLTPSLVVKDPSAAVDFYRRAFGFETKTAMPGKDGKIMHAETQYKDAVVMLSPEGGFGCQAKTPASTATTPPFGLYVYCDDVDAIFSQATRAGAKPTMPPQDMFWGDRMCSVTDPDGYVWNFATNTGDFDPSKAPY